MNNFVQWFWIVDKNCHNILTFINDEKLFSWDTFMPKLKRCLSSIFLHECILEKVQLQLDHHHIDNLSRRIIFVCLITKILTLNEPNYFYIFGDEKLSPLESVLKLLDKIKLCFDDIEKLNLIDKLWLLTLKQLVLKSDSEKNFFFLSDIAHKYGKNISTSLWSNLLDDSAALNKNFTSDYSYSYISEAFEIIKHFDLNSDLPFLLKLENVIGTHCTQENVSELVAKNVNEQVDCQISLVNKLCVSFSDNLHNDYTHTFKKNAHDKSISDEVADTDNQSYVTADDSFNQSSLETISVEDIFCDDPDPICNVKNKTVTSNSALSFTIEKLSTASIGRVWSPLHDAYIILGVEKFGVGAWAKIMQEFSFPFLNTGKHIKDRWRTLLKNNLVKLNSEKLIDKVDVRYDKYLKLAQNKCKQSVNISSQCKQNSKTFSTPKKVKSILGNRKCWSDEEDAYIIAGVSSFGIGSWAKIKSTFPFSSKRSAVNIKDRWRTMLKRKLVEVNKKGKVVKYSNHLKKLLAKLKQFQQS